MSADAKSAEPAKAARKKLTEAQKAALAALKAWRGEEQAERLKAHLVEGRKTKKIVRDALGNGPATVPELAQATGLATQAVLWQVTALKKYGEVREAEADGDYPRYQLVSKA